MLFYKIYLEGTANEIKSMIGEMTNYDESFQSDELGTDFDFMEDGNPEISNIEEVEQMADTLKSAAPDSKFKIMGTVENHDYFMDFEITYDSKELLSKSSDWYISYFVCKDNYKTYDDFCSQTNLGKKVSKEQFEKWINEECEIIVLDSGDGDVCLKAPLSERNKSSWDDYEFTCCPVCGEMCDDITPPIIGKDGKMYHWWCAEDAKVDGIIWGTGKVMIKGIQVDD